MATLFDFPATARRSDRWHVVGNYHGAAVYVGFTCDGDIVLHSEKARAFPFPEMRLARKYADLFTDRRTMGLDVCTVEWAGS